MATSPPSRAALRRFTEAVLPTDDDVTAVCIDRFPEVRRHLGSGTSPVAKISLIIEHALPSTIMTALRCYAPERCAEYEHLLSQQEVAPSNPYQGLAAFQLNDAHLFFGREALTDKLWQKFASLSEKPEGVRLLAILGPSGSGKSSVARAGLLAMLEQRPVAGARAFRRVVVHPGAHPVRSLALAVLPLVDDEQLSPSLRVRRRLIADLAQPNAHGDFDGLTLWTADLPNLVGTRVVLLVDQFEEIYTLCSDQAERDAFVRLLLHSAGDRARHISIVLTLRSDFIGETQRHHLELNRLIVEQCVLVGGMSHEELRRSISTPAAQAGRPIDDATIELLLKDATGSEGTLPLLEFALTRIWEGMLSDRAPGVTLREIGGVGGALAGRAQEIYEALSAADQAIVRRSLIRLVQLGEGTQDTRRRMAVHELCGRGETPAQVLEALRQFATVNTRLLTLSFDGSDAIAEVTHEALFEHWTALRQWIDAGRTDRRFHDRATDAARLWDQAGRPIGRLWRPPDLALLRDYQLRKSDEINQQLACFLTASEHQYLRDKFLNYVAIFLVFSTFLLSVSIFVYQGYRREQLERQRTKEAARVGEQFHQQLLSTYVERGRLLLVHENKALEALPWLNRAHRGGSNSEILPDLLRNAIRTAEATTMVLSGHSEGVRSATYSPDGHSIATISYDQTARIWNAETGVPKAVLSGHKAVIQSVVFSHNGRRVLTVGYDKIVKIWDATSGKLLRDLKGHSDHVYTAHYSHDDRFILTASRDKTARIWDSETGLIVTVISGHTDIVNSAIFSPDGNSILTASNDRTARIWSTQTGHQIIALRGHEDNIASAAYSPDGKRVVTASFDKTAQIWDAQTGGSVAELMLHRDRVHSATYSPDGRRILTTAYDQAPRIWDADSGMIVAELTGHKSIVYNAAYSPDGTHIVTASYDKSVRIWDSETGSLISEFKGHSDRVYSATYSPNGKHIATTSGDKTVRIWNAETQGHTIELRGGMKVSIIKFAYSHDGKRFVSVDNDNRVLIWSAETGRILLELARHVDKVQYATFSPNGRHVVTASKDKVARVWDADTGRPLVVLKNHHGAVHSAKYSPDGCHIITSSADGTAIIWEAGTGRFVAALVGHFNEVLDATYSADGEKVATASSDGTVRVWEAKTGQLIVVLNGHLGAIHSVIFSPDGQRIVTASADNSAHIWDAKTAQHIAELKGHLGFVHSTAYSPDGRRITTACADKMVRVWEAETARLIAEFQGHSGSIHSVMYSPDGQRIVTASADATARVWDVSPETRSAAQIEQLLRCKWHMRFVRDDSDELIPSEPAADCTVRKDANQQK